MEKKKIQNLKIIQKRIERLEKELINLKLKAVKQKHWRIKRKTEIENKKKTI